MATRVRVPGRTPEQDIKLEIKQMLDREGICWVPVNGGPGGRDGAPDIVACHNGRFYGLEGKTPTGRLRPAQKAFKADLEASGGIYAVVRSAEDVRILMGLEGPC